MKTHVKTFQGKENLLRGSAKYLENLVGEILFQKERCTLVLAGGSTPKGVYELLASKEFNMSIDWSNVHLFWGDERCVPPDHPDSNYRMAKEALIDHIDIPPENVKRIPAEKEPAEAARGYEETIKRFFSETTQPPVFDIMLLGIGEDGHTASLFPGTDVIDEKERWVKEVYVEKLDTHRITLTFPVINRAKNVIFLVAGASKAEIVKQIYNRTDTTFPAARVVPENGEIVYFLDREAGCKVEKL